MTEETEKEGVLAFDCLCQLTVVQDLKERQKTANNVVNWLIYEKDLHRHEQNYRDGDGSRMLMALKTVAKSVCEPYQLKHRHDCHNAHQGSDGSWCQEALCKEEHTPSEHFQRHDDSHETTHPFCLTFFSQFDQSN